MIKFQPSLAPKPSLQRPLFWRPLALLILFLLSSQSYAHDDLDLGLKRFVLSPSCELYILLENPAKRLPSSFYAIDLSAYIELRNDQKTAVLHRIGQLDTHKSLARRGGQLMLATGMVLPPGKQQVHAQLFYGEEFLDFNQRNDEIEKILLCEQGQGLIESQNSPPSKFDWSLLDWKIDANNCELSGQIQRLNKLAVPAALWHENGVAIALSDADSFDKLAEIPLGVVDKQRKLKDQFSLLIHLPIDLKNHKNIKLALWRVPNDGDFSNNSVQLAVPSSCQ